MIKRSASKRSSHRRNGIQSRIGTTPAIESLESRRLLTAVVVNTIADSTDATGSKTVSLRDAITMANKSTSATSITFDPTVFATAKTIVLGSTLDFAATQATTVTGSTAGVTINGNGKFRGIEIDTGTVSLSHLTVTDCTYGSGAGINNDGTLTLTASTLVGNDATANDDGGGIRNGDTATLIDDTFANNTGDGILVEGATTIRDCTISGNSSYAPFTGGGIYIEAGSANVGNTIIAGNKLTGGQTGGPDVFGTVVSAGHNLIGATDNSTGWGSTDLKGTVAKLLSAGLGALANNGGPTETFLPATGSVAINAGSNSLVPSGTTSDQRGLTRIVGSAVDIGSVEVQPTATLTLTAPAAQTATAGTSKSFSLGSFTETGATAPYTATVIWGDGTANTTIKLTTAGTIPATAHTFSTSGSKSISVTVTDSASHTSNKTTFTVTVAAVIANASISGTVFNDANGDGKLDDGEAGLGLYTVYIDLKDTGKFVTGDPIATTNILGAWSFTGLAAGTYVIRVEPVAGLTTTTPTGGVKTITLTAGETSVDNLFGEKAS